MSLSDLGIVVSRVERPICHYEFNFSDIDPSKFSSDSITQTAVSRFCELSRSEQQGVHSDLLNTIGKIDNMRTIHACEVTMLQGNHNDKCHIQISAKRSRKSRKIGLYEGYIESYEHAKDYLRFLETALYYAPYCDGYQKLKSKYQKTSLDNFR
ncbi:MAG TPA: hypothetical protein PLO43_04570 [Chlamydiales bacterium]|nr:hypothetical protein [Chlamydiales bacterium]